LKVSRRSVPPSRSSATALLVAASFLAGALCAVASAKSPSADESTALDDVLAQSGGGFVYTYHVPTGAEALFDAAVDPDQVRNVIRAHPKRAWELRRAMETRLRVPSLRALRSRHEDSIRSLRSLGYL
jgi:hypothetical protein